MTKGERIHALRVERNLTMEALGKKIGVGKATIKKYENGIIDNIPSDKIEALADALESTPQYIMGWEETDSENTSGTLKTNEARIISGGVEKMPPEARKRALDMMKLAFAEYAHLFEDKSKNI